MVALGVMCHLPEDEDMGTNCQVARNMSDSISFSGLELSLPNIRYDHCPLRYMVVHVCVVLHYPVRNI